METVYVVTLWSGGRPGKRWKTLGKPEILANGTGVSFTDLETKLGVTIIGSISVEEYEQALLASIELERPRRSEEDNEAP